MHKTEHSTLQGGGGTRILDLALLAQKDNREPKLSSRWAEWTGADRHLAIENDDHSLIVDVV